MESKGSEMKRFFILFGVLFGFLALAACSGNKAEREGPLAVSTEELGPDTEDLVKDLPKGLVGDQENARYTNDNLRGEDEDEEG